jgi:predicted Zn-dependent protease
VLDQARRFRAAPHRFRCRVQVSERILAAALFSATVLLNFPSTACAQRERNGNKQPDFPFNPQSFFDQFFGSGNPEQQEELARVKVSVREENEYGEQVFKSFQDDFKRRKINLVNRGKEVEYLRKLLETLRPHMANRERYPSIQVLLADSEITDAYSIPGGTLIVFRGLMDLAETEAELTGVLGHELSHLDRGHQLLPIRRNKLAQQNFNSARNDPSAMFRQANLFMSAFMRPFRPEDEAQADQDGATWTYRAGYDPRAMAVLFNKLQERDRGGQFAPAFLRTHPYHSERRAAIERLYAELQRAEPKSDLYLGRTNLKRRVPMSERRFED